MKREFQKSLFDLEAVSPWQEISDSSIRFEKSMEPLRRKRTGSYYTSMDLTDIMMSDLIKTMDEAFLKNISSKRFLEPCVGTGNFIFAYLKHCSNLGLSKNEYRKLLENIYVCDINEDALRLYKANLKKYVNNLFGIELDDLYFETHIGSGLLYNVNQNNMDYIPIESVFSKDIIKDGFDIIVTNPPYKNLKAERSQYLTDDEYDVDPKLEKAVMVGGIAAAIVVAVIVFVIVGNMMGWFSFGERRTTEATTTEETTTEEAKITMPDVVGLSEKAAEKELKEAGSTNYQFVQEHSTEVKEGYVISQNVEQNTEIAKDTQIIITVSAGAEELEIADVTGMDEDSAYETLTSQGFKPTRSYKFDDEIDEGCAISTDPKAGSKAKAGDSIVIYISQGQEEKLVGVPELVGLTEAAARGSIEANKLTVGNVTYEFNSDVEAGLVIRQSITKDTQVKEGSTIDIVISNGAETKTYKGKVSGNVSTSDPGLANATVTLNVYINDDAGYHLAYTVTAPGGYIEVNGESQGLSYNNGTVSFTVVDQNGADVSGMYNKSLTLSYEDE